MAKTSITRLLLAALTFSITPLLTGQSTLNEDFTANPTTEFAPPWACSPPVILGHGDWLVMNARTNFNSSNTNRVDLDGSTARLSSDDNDAMGGYLALVHSFSNPLASWTLTVKVKVDEAYPDRPVPSCFVPYRPVLSRFVPSYRVASPCCLRSVSSRRVPSCSVLSCPIPSGLVAVPSRAALSRFVSFGLIPSRPVLFLPFAWRCVPSRPNPFR